MKWNGIIIAGALLIAFSKNWLSDKPPPPTPPYAPTYCAAQVQRRKRKQKGHTVHTLLACWMLFTHVRGIYYVLLLQYNCVNSGRCDNFIQIYVLYIFDENGNRLLQCIIKNTSTLRRCGRWNKFHVILSRYICIDMYRHKNMISSKLSSNTLIVFKINHSHY